MAESFRRRRLPHWDTDNATYFVTSCLVGSVPARGLLPSRLARRAEQRSAESAGQRFAAWDAMMDTRPSVTWLGNAAMAEIVQESLLFGHQSRYTLMAYVVMPSHIHWVFSPFAGVSLGERWSRSRILASFKRHTARKCNRLLSRQGAFWQAESYDRVVRDAEELERIVQYIERNPVRARLCRYKEEWRFSSAFGGWSSSNRGADL